MSFVISNILSGKVKLPERKLEKPKDRAVKVSEKKPQVAQASPQKINPKISDRLRYEVSSLSQKSIKLQKGISRDQIILGAMDKLEESLEQVARTKSPQSLQKLKEVVEKTEFEGKKLLKSNPNRSSEPKLDPVTVAKPPQVGQYSVSILKRENTGGEISYTIDLDDTQDYNRSLTTSINRTNGLIEGVEIFFEQIEERVEANVEIVPVDEDSFPVPDFSKSVKFIEQSLEDKEQIKSAIDQTSRKIEITREGIKNSVNEQMIKFNNVVNAQENIKASSPDSVSTESAQQAIEKTNEMLVRESSTAKDLFTNQDVNFTQNLLK